MLLISFYETFGTLLGQMLPVHIVSSELLFGVMSLSYCVPSCSVLVSSKIQLLYIVLCVYIFSSLFRKFSFARTPA